MSDNSACNCEQAVELTAYIKRMLEEEPNGTWVSDEGMALLAKWENTDGQEQEASSSETPAGQSEA